MGEGLLKAGVSADAVAVDSEEVGSTPDISLDTGNVVDPDGSAGLAVARWPDVGASPDEESGDDKEAVAEDGSAEDFVSVRLEGSVGVYAGASDEVEGDDAGDACSGGEAA